MIINQFNSLEDMQLYHNTIMLDERFISINTLSKYLAYKNIIDTNILELLRSFSSGNIDEESFNQRIETYVEDCGEDYMANAKVEFQELSFKYIYPWSKTIFRNTFHENLAPSLYNVYYAALKDQRIIDKANGTFVTLRDVSFQSDSTNVLIQPYTVAKADEFVGSVYGMIDDIKYYQNMIQKLNTRILDLEEENIKLQSQVYSKTLATWY